MGNTILGVCYCWGLGVEGVGVVRVHRVGGQTWEEREVSVIRGHCMKFPNN